MKIKSFLTLALLIITSFSSFSQINRKNFCSHDQENYDRMAVDPAYKKTMDSIENIQKIVEQNYINSSVSRAGTILYIPVVYHIIHEGGVENISDAQIHSDIAEVNRLYSKQNSNVGNVKSNFLSRVADVEIKFILAQKKPDGTCFSGITRTFSSHTNTGRNDAMNAVKAVQGNYPGNQYLNILVAKNIGGAAGYTYRPGGPYYAAMNNGIHILHTYVGNIGTSTQTGVNTTMAHEIGHWLNLPHTWGGSNTPGLASNCSIDDGISDTPNTIGWSYCNVNGVTCGTLDNVENIMDYSYCSKMFTNGQKTKMRASLSSTIGGRNNMVTSANHTATGIFDDIICKADFSSDILNVCEGGQVHYEDASYHNATSWSWTFDAGSPRTSTSQNPVVTYNTPGRHSVFLTVSNASGTKSVVKTQYIKVMSNWGKNMPYGEGFEGSASNFADDWSATTNGSQNWKQTNAAANGGSKSVMLQNFHNSAGTISNLESQTINLSGSKTVTISYKYAYAKKSGTVGEQVQLLVSKNCGASWLTRRGLNQTTSSQNSNFVPNSSQWTAHNVTIDASYFTSNFRFKFRVKGGGGNNVYIDEINLNRTVGNAEINAFTDLEIYPNPMNENSTVSLDIANQAMVSVSIINVLGKTVSVLEDSKNSTAGNHKYQIQKNNLSSGIYFVNVTVNGKSKLKKLVIR